MQTVSRTFLGGKAIKVSEKSVPHVGYIATPFPFPDTSPDLDRVGGKENEGNLPG